MGQQRQPSPFKQGFNPAAESFIPAAEAQPKAVPNTPEKKIPKSNGRQGVKNSAPSDKICFRCKQPGHLKKDCPKLPYCSKCHTRGHVSARCPTRNQGNKQQDNQHEYGNQQMDQKWENWKCEQDQPQFSNPNNRCLHCSGDQQGTMEVVSRGVLKALSLLALSILSSFSLLTTSQVLNFGVEVC